MLQMRNISYLLLFFIFFKQSSSYNCSRYIYTYELLVLNWPNQYCYHNACKENLNQITRDNQLVIQGLWPASQDLDFINCLQLMGHDPNCYINFQYNQAYLNDSIKYALSEYWPEIGLSNDLREDQWSSHGTCYLSIKQTLNESMIGQENKLFIDYFKYTLGMAKNISLKIRDKSFDTKAKLALSLKLKQSQFFVLCEYDNDFLSQVRVCYSLDGSSNPPGIISCPGSEPNQCEFPIKVRINVNFQTVLKFAIFIELAIMIILL